MSRPQGSSQIVSRQESSESETIRRLIGRLESLRDGEDTVMRLIACGAAAVEPLRDYLLRGRPGPVAEPRRRAVEALAGLGADAVLFEYLDRQRDIVDPVVRLAEDAVEAEAARALSGSGAEEVFRLLLRRTVMRSTPGFVEALGRFARREAIPVLLRALEDDLCRGPAEEALGAMAERARGALVDAALAPDPDARDESPSSLRRRRSALRLLERVDLGEEDWGRLRSLARAEDIALTVSVARLALRWGDVGDRRAAGRRLLRALPAADVFLQMDIEETLARLYDDAGDLVEEELGRREATRERGCAPDCMLAALRRIRDAARRRSRDGGP